MHYMSDAYRFYKMYVGDAIWCISVLSNLWVMHYVSDAYLFYKMYVSDAYLLFFYASDAFM